MFTYPRVASPPPPPLWMVVVGGLSVFGASVALMLGSYKIADVGIILYSVVLLLLALRRHRERRRQATEPPDTPRDSL